MLPLTQQIKNRHYLFSLTLALSVIFLMPFMAFASTITVNTTADEFGTGASCSLREAIESANTNTAFGGCATAGAAGMDTVNVPTGIYTLTIMGQGEDLNATGDLDIYADTAGIILNGTGVVSSDVVIDANSIDRVIHGLVALNLNNLTIKGGYEAYGGGAYFTLAASVTRTIFSGNTSGLISGGAYFDSTASVMETTFSDNTAVNDGGGAIFNSTASMTGTTFRGNSTTSGSGSGGATFNSTASVMETTFMSNTATSGSGGAYFTLATSVIDSAFMSNTTTSGNGGGAYFGDTASVMGTTFNGNTASSGGGATFNSTTSMTGTTFNGNMASSNGGGAAFWSTTSVMGATFNGNTGSSGGGAMFGGTASVTGTTFSGNTASSGGGAYFVDAASVTGTTFNGNTATFGGGGAYFDAAPANRLVVNVLFSRNQATFYGAAIYVSDASPLEIIHTTIASPTVPTGAPEAVYVTGGTVYLTNTIIASHTTGIQQAAGTVAQNYNLFFGNGANTGGTVTSGGNSLTGQDPLFTAPMSDDYHLLSGSPASGMGIPLGILTDYDGDARSATAPALGYDEMGGMPIISIANVTTLENNGSLLFTVTLSAVSLNPVTVTYQTVDGTATTSDSDYTAIGATQLFMPAGSLYQTITVTVTPDTKYETDETLVISLTNPLSATLAISQATGTIQNDDTAPTISMVGGSELENNGSLLFTVTLNAASALPVTVTYQTVDGTATTADSDYTGIGATQLFMPAGSLFQTITVTVTGDTQFETDETMLINLTSPMSATLAVTQAIGTIQNDDTAPTISMANSTELENNGSLLFTVTLSTISGAPVTVTYQTADGTATMADNDYTAIGATPLLIPAGNLSATFNVTLIGDINFEADETMLVNLTSPVNATLAVTQATGTIQNDDTVPTISIADGTGLENNESLLFTVTLSAMSSFPITVTYQTADGTATTADNDYTAIGATQLVIPVGSSAATFNVTLIGDINFEADETMLVNLTSPVSATMLDNQAIGTIQNDDFAPTPTPTNTPMPTATPMATATSMPTPTSTPVFSASQNITYTYAITAADAENNLLTFSAPTLPNWLTFIDNGNGTALLSGSPTLSNGGTIGNHSVILQVSDTVSTTQQAFVIAVVSPTLLSGRAGLVKSEKIYLPILLHD